MRFTGKCLAALAAIALFGSAVADASVARLRGLNVPPDYVHQDWTGMFTYLSEVNGAGNLAYVDAGSADYGYGDHGMGAVLPGLFGKSAGTWAFHLRQTAPSLGSGWVQDPVSTGWGGFDENRPGEAFDVMWGRKFGESELGLRLHRSFESYDDGTDVTEGNGDSRRNVLGLGAGMAANLNPQLRWELAAQFQTRKFDEGPAGESNDGANAMLFAARAFHMPSRTLTLVPAFKYWSVDMGRTDNLTSEEFEEKRSGLQMGLAGNWTVGSGDLIVFGAQFVRNDMNLDGDDQEDEVIAPNVFIGLETRLNTWLSFRAGAQDAMFYQWHNTFSDVERTWKQHYFTFNLGTSVRFDRFTLDATLDPAFLQNPFAQLMGGTQASFSGSGDTRGAAPSGGYVPFPQVTATYYW